MKGRDREIYVQLTGAMGIDLCGTCKHGRWEGSGSICCDDGEGYHECTHPIDNLSWANVHEDYMEPGTDCYGFEPKVDIETLSELVSTILTKEIDEWSVVLKRHYFKITTYRYGDDKGVYTQYTYREKVRA